jgi:glycosyltransferase involved in cell wall biosynthesis
VLTSPASAASPAPARPLRVHVLVDLARGTAAGGHVKVWERLAAAAVGMAEALDLTVHFSGERPDTERLADNVRFRTHPPVFSTARLPFLSRIPAHTDLARHHPALAAALDEADVLHTTDAYFAFARTAERLARRQGVPLVSSVHTDTPLYTAVCLAEILEQVMGPAVGRLLAQGLHLPRHAQARMERRLLAHQRRCAHALVSRPAERDRLAGLLAPERVGLLRRGIDRGLFSPARRDRAWLEATFSLPADRVVLLYVGRLDACKNVLALADAVRALVAEGGAAHLLCVGQGPDRAGILERLPGAATCPGVLPPETVARIYASADLFAQPSVTEESSNVVHEALTSGLPVVVTARSAGRLVVDGETGAVVPDGEPESWMEALRALVEDRARRERLGAQGRAFAEHAIPSWGEVLAEDLLPRWQDAAAARRGRAPGRG